MKKVAILTLFLAFASNSAVVNGNSTAHFIRGDVSGEGIIDITDVIILQNYLYLGSSDINCMETADVDDSASLNNTDIIYLLEYIFNGGVEPPTPFPNCGEDQTEDSFDCEEYTACY